MTPGGTAIKITLYDKNDEVIKECSRSIIPWGIMKRALKLAKSINVQDLSDEDLENLTALVAEVFGNQISIQELENGADTGEMLTVLMGIVARVSKLMPANPTPPGT